MIFAEDWFNLGTGAGFSGIQTWMVNAFSFLAPGVTDETFMGNEIIDPLLVFRGAVTIDWLALSRAAQYTPTVEFDVWLIAVNDQTSIITPRSTTTPEDTGLFIRYPGRNMTPVMNTQNVTVLRKKRIRFSPREIGTASASSTGYSQLETRNFKITKKLRGKKEFETTVPNVAVPTATPQAWLKGYNYFWVMTKMQNAGFPAAAINQPIDVEVDRYVYFKDP